MLPHSDNLVPVDCGLLPKGNVCVCDKLLELVPGHSQINAGVIGSQVHPHPVAVDFEPVEFINPDALRHFAATLPLISPPEGCSSFPFKSMNTDGFALGRFVGRLA